LKLATLVWGVAHQQMTFMTKIGGALA